LRFIGDIDNEYGGLGKVRAGLISKPNKISAPIDFYIDTGATKTTINRIDAARNNIYSANLELSKRPVTTVSGPVLPLILNNCSILFLGAGSVLMEIGDVNVLGLDQPSNPISVLGLDVLKVFSIRFDIKNGRVILER
jgi:predicted aspartyl protease